MSFRINSGGFRVSSGGFRVAPLPTIITDGLVLYLDAGNTASYPGSGTTWTDLSGNGNNGTLVNGPTFSSANSGNIVFDGTDDYADLVNNSNTLFSNSQSHSFSLWLRKNGNNSGNFAYIYDRYGTYRTPGLLFDLNTNTLVVEWRTSTNAAWTFLSSGLAVDTNIWNFVTVTINAPGTGQTKTINVYLYKSTGLNTATMTSGTDWNADTNGPFSLGVSISNGTYFNGAIAQVLTYNKVLSASEVSQNYNALKSRFGL
jgi:hypothetical protein